MIFGKGLLIELFPFFVGALFIGLCTAVYVAQKTYAHIDAAKQGVKEQLLTFPQ
jgi:ABC-type arginine transport system permease subunit